VVVTGGGGGAYVVVSGGGGSAVVVTTGGCVVSGGGGAVTVTVSGVGGGWLGLGSSRPKVSANTTAARMAASAPARIKTSAVRLYHGSRTSSAAYGSSSPSSNSVVSLP
jgi:hypothetical protein